MTSTGSPHAAKILIAEESYRRCQGEPFFQAFYRRLLEADEVIRAKFAATDFERQNKLLQHGIGLLFSFARRRNPALLSRIADRHGPHDLDVAPGLYPHFVESLVGTVRERDAACTPEVEDAWRAALAPGIEFMIRRHEFGEGDGAAGGAA